MRSLALNAIRQKLWVLTLKPLKDGPSGYVSNSLDEAIRGFQTDNGLDADGILNPGGPTIAALSNAVGEGRNASGMVHVQAYEQGRDGKTVHVSDYQRRRPGEAGDAFRASEGDALPTPWEGYLMDTPKQEDVEAPTVIGDDGRPIINKGADRIRNIIDNKPGRFRIQDNHNEDGSAPLWRNDERGRQAVEKYGKIIEEEARKQGLDPDLAKAVLYYENADGHYYGLNDIADELGGSGSVAPMNINPEIWGGLGIDRKTSSDPRTNIRAGVTLLKRIQDRVDDPTPEKIGTLWNGIKKEKITQRGARIGRIAREKPWEKQK